MCAFSAVTKVSYICHKLLRHGSNQGFLEQCAAIEKSVVKALLLSRPTLMCDFIYARQLMKKHLITFAAFLMASQAPTVHASRDYIEIVGSSTVYPFATSVAERFGKKSDFKTPKIESTGSGGGMKLFCNGVGTGYPDVTNASRRMKQSEFDKCQANGVTEIVEVLIGFDGIAFANSRKSEQYEISLKDIYLALAKDVPNPDGSETFVANPYKTWQDVNPELPALAIEVLGPPPTSGTRDAFVELALADLSGTEQDGSLLPIDQEGLANLLATLNMFSAMLISQSLAKLDLPSNTAIYVSGGGTHNKQLMQNILECVDGFSVHTIEKLGMSSDAKEAALFAVLANQSLYGDYQIFANKNDMPATSLGKLSFP